MVGSRLSLTLSIHFTDSVGNINRWRQFERFAVKDGKVQRFAGSWQDIPEATE